MEMPAVPAFVIQPFFDFIHPCLRCAIDRGLVKIRLERFERFVAQRAGVRQHDGHLPAAAREQGLSVYLSSTYRDYATQTYLYNRKVSQYGEEIAKTIVAPPGTSEHQLGLAADITDKYYEFKDESLENTELFQWMSANCAQYGFIVRYPKDKEDVTGIDYESWHYRYVGIEAARYLTEQQLTLDEFWAS